MLPFVCVGVFYAVVWVSALLRGRRTFMRTIFLRAISYLSVAALIAAVGVAALRAWYVLAVILVLTFARFPPEQVFFRRERRRARERAAIG